MHDSDERWLKIVSAPRVLIAVLIVWLLSPILMKLLVGALEDAGQAGDSYGAVNALFSGLAFVGVIYAILLQRNELQLQREELSLTRAELERAASAQERSEAALREQAEVMKIVAELNGLSFLVQAESMQLQVLYSEGSTGSRPRANLIKPLEDDRDQLLASLKARIESVRAPQK